MFHERVASHQSQVNTRTSKGFHKLWVHQQSFVPFRTLDIIHNPHTHSFLSCSFLSCAHLFTASVVILVILRWNTEGTELNWDRSMNRCMWTHCPVTWLGSCPAVKGSAHRKSYCLHRKWSRSRWHRLPNTTLSPSPPPDDWYTCNYARPSAIPFCINQSITLFLNSFSPSPGLIFLLCSPCQPPHLNLLLVFLVHCPHWK